MHRFYLPPERVTEGELTRDERESHHAVNVLRLRQGDVDLPLDGGSDTLRASPLWDVDDDGRLSVRQGASFIQWVEWLPGQRVSSRSIQPFGAATTRPASPPTSARASACTRAARTARFSAGRGWRRRMARGC